MPVEVILPKVDMDMATGSIATWHAKPGDSVTKGEPLFDIETDKAAMEVESPASGTLHHISVDEGDEVAIGTTLAWIYGEGEEVGEPPSAPAQSAKPENNAPERDANTNYIAGQSDAIAVEEPAAHSKKLRATPAARALARDNTIDLDGVTGTGPRDRIGRADVEAYLDAYSDIQSPALAPLKRWAPQSGDLFVLSSGKGTIRPWVLIHGFAADASAWNAVEKVLSKSAPVHRVELPNHGNSPHRVVKDFPDLVSQMRQALDGLDLKDVRLVGHSLGAAVALALADTRPKKIDSLTLLAPAGLGPDINGAVLHGIASATKPQSLGPWLKQLPGNPDMITDSYTRVAMATRQDPAMRAAQAAMMDALFPDRVQAFDLRGALKRITCPTRIIWGKRDAIIPWGHAMGVPGTVSLNLFANIGHLPHVEIADEVCALLNR